MKCRLLAGALVLLAACTATGESVVRPEILHPASEHPLNEAIDARLVYTLPGMEEVAYTNAAYGENITLDAYYPPGHEFRESLPAVIIVNGLGDGVAEADFGSRFRDTPWFVSWAQLFAAAGFVGVTHDALNPEADLAALLDHLSSEGDSLGIDAGRICLHSFSAHSLVALQALMALEGASQENVRCAVFYFGLTEYGGELRLSGDLAVLVARAGRDHPRLNAALDRFVDEAMDQGHSVELLSYEEGMHGFEMRQDTEESRNIVARTLEFLQEQLEG